MKQILHIFRKDVRHHWPEIVISLVALAAYAWRDIWSWGPQTIPGSIGAFMGVWASGLILFLLPVSWWFLILRVVQNESLVGDRQFWITRPYEWKELLAAKVLFVVVFINVPVLITGTFLLRRAGFSPAAHWLGLLWIQVLLVEIPFLPFATLAAVTRNVAQGLLAMLAVMLYMVGYGVLSVATQSPLASIDASDWLRSAVLILAGVAAIWLQYAHRRTAQALSLLASAAALNLIILSVTSFVTRPDRDFQTPAAGSQPPFRASLWGNPPSPKDTFGTGQPAMIQIPIEISGLGEGSLAQIKAAMLAVETADGFRWNSGWQMASSPLLLPGPSLWRQNFEVDNKTFERVKSVPVTAHISVAATVFREGNARQMTTGSAEFLIPDVGRCRVDSTALNIVRCLSPLVKPSPLLMRADLAASTCPLAQQNDHGHDHSDDTKQTNTNDIAYAWEWHGEPGLAEYGVSPVESFQLYFRSREAADAQRIRICPGTPLGVSFPKPVERTRVEFDINGLKLSNYRVKGFAGEGAINFSISR